MKYGEGLDKSNFREFIFNSNANIYLNLTPSSQIHDFCFGFSASYMYYQEPAQEYNYQSTEYGSRSYTSLGSAHDQLLGAGLILDYKGSPCNKNKNYISE